MYRFIKDFSLKYTDTDFNDNLKLSALCEMLEEAACLSAEELGFGYSVLQPKGYGFILANWYIELFRPVKLGEILTVHTWPLKPKKLIVLRDFEFYVGSEKVGVGTSRWCLVNLSDFSMLPASAVFSEGAVYNDFRSVDIANFKIASIGCAEPSYSKIVSYSDYDHYYHVNNTKYADFLLDAFSVEEMKGKSISKVRINYVKQSKFGDVLTVFKQRQSDGSWVVEAKACGELRTQMQVEFND